tara:strand:- start:1858 stop:2220 length:363 start_codon:yes stop_codon:yes gene_type:complete
MSEILKIEPLRYILDNYSDKNSIFINYLNQDIINKIDGYIFYEDNIDQLFIYDKIYCIDKSTLKIAQYGQIIYHSNNDITLKKNSKYFVRINPEDYYIFYKRKLKKNSKKDFMVSLLKIL